MSKDIFEKVFGKAPESGYEFKDIVVTLVDNERFKGFDFAWTATGIGFGHFFMGWGLDDSLKEEFPKQYGFYSDTECMSDEFIQALLVAAAPKIVELVTKCDLTSR